MTDMLAFDAPKQRASIIKVLGVGGGGSNAVNHMHKQGIKGVDFIICNTDAQAMDQSDVPNKIQLGSKGLGAGAVPDVGRKSAEENLEDIKGLLESNTKMLFITAGMGGGTGTGATPVIAQMAREMDILTVAIVTLPFSFEGRKRRLQAEKGIEELKKQVDTLLIISNEKLREIHGNLKLSEAFGRADDILTIAAKGIAEIITVTGYINVDFEDVKTVMKSSGTAIMGSAVAEGEDRAKVAVQEALASPLLNDNKITGASDILLYISSGKEEITFDEVSEITDYIQTEAGSTAEVIWGNGFDESLGDKISITLIATGFATPEEVEETTMNREKKKIVHTLTDTPAPKRETPEKEKVEEKPEEPRSEDDALNEIKLIKKATDDTPSRETENAVKPPVKSPSLFDQPKPKSKNILDEGSKNTDQDVTALNNKRSNGLRIRHTVGSFENKSEEDSNMMEKKTDDRVKRLKEFNFMGKNSTENIEDLEKVPAYVRKKVELAPVKASSESSVAKYTLGEDENQNPEIESKDIPYIHNKPD